MFSRIFPVKTLFSKQTNVHELKTILNMSFLNFRQDAVFKGLFFFNMYSEEVINNEDPRWLHIRLNFKSLEMLLEVAYMGMFLFLLINKIYKGAQIPVLA